MHTYLIYLASGNSRRFEQNKLLYSFHGKPLFRHTLDQILETNLHLTCESVAQFDTELNAHPDTELIVVTHYDEIQNYLSDRPDVHTVLCPESVLGVSYSIRAALDVLKNCSRPFYMVFIVADQPYLKWASIRRLIQESTCQHALLSTLSCGERVGNPTLFHSDFYDELYDLKDDQGGRRILKKHPELVYPVTIENEKEFYDIDFPEDLPK